MKQKEALILAIGVFLTIIAWVVIEVYKIGYSQLVEEEIQLPEVKRYNVNTEVIDKLQKKQP